MICFAILKHRGTIQPDEWALFIRGAGVVDRSAQKPNPNPANISEQQWDLLYATETRISVTENGADAYPFRGLTKSILGSWEEWKVWMDQPNPHLTTIPEENLEKSLNSFKRLILLKCLKEDKLLSAIQRFVADQIGKEFSVAPQATMADIARDLDNKTPCIFILSKGADPTGTLLRFAKEQGYADTLSLVSLGQGQGEYAKQLVNDGSRKLGNWVLLQNCMLAKSWMNELENLIFELVERTKENKPTFRLFLTSMPADYFPVSVLQNGVKMTNEPPNGVKANVSRVFDALVKAEDWDTCSMPSAWKKLITGLSFFHANVQERRKFGPLGWNIRYGFDESDLETSIAILRRFLDTMDVIPWDALVFVTGHINYGGRVTDDWDRRCLMSILSKFIRREVLTDEYKFSASGTYYAPKVGKLDDFKDYLRKLPSDDNPEVFGMHQNANTAFNKDQSITLMQTLLSLQPRESGGGSGKSLTCF